MPLQAGELLRNRYQVVRSLKAGGMGAVYEAIDRNLADTPCAIKEVLPSALQGPDAEYVLRSFASEMKALANLNHPNIPRVRDFFEDEGKRYIVMDLVQGQGLDDELAEHLRVTGEAMDPAVAALDMVQVLETLHHLHTGQPALIHRDIKPANLIRDQRSGKIRLVDFGIARSVETQRMQTQVGTPGFCAPEQMAGRAEPRSDIFSVGATLCFLVTGKQGPFYAYQALKPDLPQHPGLAEIIEKATEVRAQDRYASAQEMAEALKTWLRSQSSGSTPARRPAPEPQAVAVPTRRATATVPAESNPKMMAALIGLLLLVSLALFISTPKAEVPEPSTSPPPVGDAISEPRVSPSATSPVASTHRPSVPPPARPARPTPPATPARPVARPAPQPVRTPARPKLEVGDTYPVKHYPVRKPAQRLTPGQQPTAPVQWSPPPAAGAPVFPTDLGLVSKERGRRWERFEHASGNTVVSLKVEWTRPSDTVGALLEQRRDQSFQHWTRSPMEPPGEFCRFTANLPLHQGIHVKPGMVFLLNSHSMVKDYEWAPILNFIRETHW